MKKRLTAILLCLVLCLSVVSGCTKAEPESTADIEPVPVVDDSVRNWYEIFVYSYADSDGDGIGDIRGMTEKLDYISDMGFTGIWLMPIMPSPSYHKYDVTDYYAIDPAYGTLEDFENFVAEAHERGIWVIIDLVVNHTSDKHPWFTASMQSDSDYHDWYTWVDSPSSGYSFLNGRYYESQFTGTMPDLNLDNEQVRDELVSIMEFWLDDMNVDGFRLDAVTSYYTGRPQACIDFLTWLNTEAEAIKPGCYIVGEAWESLLTINMYYQSGCDAFFCFPTSQMEGYIAKIVKGLDKEPAVTFCDTLIKLQETFGVDTLQANFLGNHDTARTGSFIGSDTVKLKLAAGTLAMMNGGCFVYYGDEIGMRGSGDDPTKRTGMRWSPDIAETTPPPGAKEVEQKLPTVAEQLEDETSVLNYYKQAMQLRLQNPEIARGAITIHESNDPQLALIQKTWNGSNVGIIINYSSEARTVSISAEAFGVSRLAGELLVDPSVSVTATLSDGVITLEMPPYSMAVLR